MRQDFELYITADQLLAEQWVRLYTSLAAYLGPLGGFDITFRCTDNVVRFFISCKKDLSTLSNATQGILLRPVAATELQLPDAHSKERFIQFVTNGNILDLKEKVAVGKTKELGYALLRVRTVST